MRREEGINDINSSPPTSPRIQFIPRSSTVRPLEWKMKYEELEKSYAILEEKLVSLQLQPPEQFNDNITRLSKETTSNGGRDIIEQYKKMISQLQEQKKVSDERIEQLTAQIYSEKKENPGQSQKRSLQRTPLSNPRDNYLNSNERRHIDRNESERDLTYRRDGPSQTEEVLREKISKLEANLKATEIKSKNESMRLRQKAQSIIDAVNTERDQQKEEITILKKERDEYENRIDVLESQLLATISELKSKNLEIHQNNSHVQLVITQLEDHLEEKKDQIIELMVNLEKERKRNERLKGELQEQKGEILERQSRRENEDEERREREREREIEKERERERERELEREKADPPMMKFQQQSGDPPMIRGGRGDPPMARGGGRGGRGGPASAIGAKRDGNGNLVNNVQKVKNENDQPQFIAPKKVLGAPKGLDMGDIISQIANGGFKLKKVGISNDDADNVALEHIEASVQKSKTKRKESKVVRERIERQKSESTHTQPLITLEDLLDDLVNFDNINVDDVKYSFFPFFSSLVLIES